MLSSRVNACSATKLNWAWFETRQLAALLNRSLRQKRSLSQRSYYRDTVQEILLGAKTYAMAIQTIIENTQKFILWKAVS
jgi:hypothetical protein